MAKSSAVKKTVEHIHPVSDVDPSTICIDFTDYMELLDGLKSSAKDNFRTPDQQLLYLVKGHIVGRESQKKGAKGAA